MTYAFVSYKREDEDRVARLARALESAGVPLWWDRGLPDGENWHQTIERKLEAADCVIVAWSKGSVGPDGQYVRDEARRGLNRGILTPVFIDPLPNPPLGFGEVQAIDLSHWRGDVRDPAFQDLVATVNARLTGAPAPSPTRGARGMRLRAIAGGAVSAGLAVLLILGLNVFGATSRICALPGFQPALSDLCGAAHVGGRPTREERLAWSARPRGDCNALEAHIRKFPDGAYRDEAVALLSAARVSDTDSWSPVVRPVVLYEPNGGSRGSLEGARQATLRAAQSDAERICRGFASGTLYRFVSAKPVADHWSCTHQGEAASCAFDGHADCQVMVRHTVEARRCDGG